MRLGTKAPPSDADVVIIGAGTAGCVLAARLSENSDLNVCLVEAGPADGGLWTRIPIGFSRTFREPRVNWLYETEPQSQLGGRRIFWPRGKLVGGSSAINGMIHIRGFPRDYDEWAVPGWSWSDVAPYFAKSEGQRCGLPDVYASDGPYTISPLPVRNEATERFIEAATAIGMKRLRSFNAGAEEGAGLYEIDTLAGRRCSAATAYLNPAMNRRNLTVVTGHLVDAVEFSGRRATGVRLRAGHEQISIGARAGVILAAGAVGTPALLQRSGIGAAARLSALGIAPRLDHPRVGRNLQDHYGVRYIARLREPITINDDFRRPWRLAAHALRYLATRRGQLAIGGAEAGLFARSRPEIDRPDIQFHFLPLSNERAGWSFHSFSGVTANVCCLRPSSRGEILIRSPDPHLAPSIDPHYLEEPEDGAVIVAGLHLARRIFASPPISRIVDAEHWPGATSVTDEALLEHAREHGSTLFHPVGTCAMGDAASDPVDPQLALRGADALWVCDASVMPRLVSGNTNAAVLMIAEKGAELVASSLRASR